MAAKVSGSDDVDAREEAQSRLATELEILYAMYPDGQLTYSSRGREVHFHSDSETGSAQTSTSKGSLILRLPECYPVSGLPEVLSASTGHRDLREDTRQAVANLGVSEGEEMLDALILAFQDLLASTADNEGETSQISPTEEDEEPGKYRPSPQNEYKTVIIWLHHLLNTNKRKLALNPGLSSTNSSSASKMSKSKSSQNTTVGNSPECSTKKKQTIISGFSKPGYPGILIFSGPRDLVTAHVSQLRAQRWQAFQVRYDSDEDTASIPQNTTSHTTSNGRNGVGAEGDSWPPPGLWEFDDVATGLEVVFEARMGSVGGGGGGGSAIQEVESISILAKHIRDQRHREVFLEAIGVK